MKSCTCGVTGEENFYRNAATADGLQFYCKRCNAKERRETYRRKYPNGRNGGLPARFAAMIGNKRAVKENRKPRYETSRSPKQSASKNTILDSIIRMAIV